MAMKIEELLKSKRQEILAIAARHGARDVRVFGSVARVPIPDPHPKIGINFYQHILFPGEFVVTMQQTHIRNLRFKY